MERADVALTSAGIVGMVFSMVLIVAIIVYVVCAIAGMWKMFEKAGEPGWTSLIPFLSLYKLYKISLGIGWLFLLALIPGVGIIMSIILGAKLAQAFDRGMLFGLGLAFLPGIFYMILGFSHSEYHKPITI